MWLISMPVIKIFNCHTSSESSGTFNQKARSLAPLNGWACAVKICHDGMLEDTKSLDAPHLVIQFSSTREQKNCPFTDDMRGCRSGYANQNKDMMDINHNVRFY